MVEQWPLFAPIVAYVVVAILIIVLGNIAFEKRRKARKKYYNEYLKSEAWKRKRYVVLKRDNWTCQECGVQNRYFISLYICKG